MRGGANGERAGAVPPAASTSSPVSTSSASSSRSVTPSASWSVRLSSWSNANAAPATAAAASGRAIDGRDDRSPFSGVAFLASSGVSSAESDPRRFITLPNRPNREPPPCSDFSSPAGTGRFSSSGARSSREADPPRRDGRRKREDAASGVFSPGAVARTGVSAEGASMPTLGLVSSSPRRRIKGRGRSGCSWLAVVGDPLPPGACPAPAPVTAAGGSGIWRGRDDASAACGAPGRATATDSA